MTKLVRLVILPLAACVVLVSCITLEENYIIKKDGSGSFVFKMDMSQLVSMMKMFEGMAQEGQENPTKELDFKEQAKKIEKIKGVNNVMISEDDEAGLYALSFDFDDFAAMDLAHKEVFDNEDDKETVLTKNGNSIFFRLVTPSELTQQKVGSDEDSLSSMMSASMLSQFNYIVKFTFEDEAVSVTTNAANTFDISNKKTFEMNANMQELVDNPALMNTEIRF